MSFDLFILELVLSLWIHVSPFALVAKFLFVCVLPYVFKELWWNIHLLGQKKSAKFWNYLIFNFCFKCGHLKKSTKMSINGILQLLTCSFYVHYHIWGQERPQPITPLLMLRKPSKNYFVPPLLLQNRVVPKSSTCVHRWITWQGLWLLLQSWKIIQSILVWFGLPTAVF